MEKCVSFGMIEEIIECDIDITYKDFLGKIQETFNLKEYTFSIIDLTEDNFDEMMTIKVNFSITRSEKDLAKERLGDKNRFNTLHAVQQVKDFLLVYGDGSDEFGDSPIHDAALNGDADFVKLILEYNFNNAHRKNTYGNTPLYWASYKGHTDVVKLLLEHNFDNILHTNNGNTPLYAATIHGHTEIVKLLLEQNFGDAYNGNEETILYAATLYNDRTDVLELLKADILRREKENE